MNSSDHYKNKKILITGGAGFIGSHLVEAFLNQQSHVTIFDNFSSGTEENIAAFKKDITVIKGNVEDYKLCNKAAQNQDYVFHLAAFVCVPTSFDDPQQCYLTNALGT